MYSKQALTFLHFVLVEVELILTTLGEIINSPDIAEEPVREDTDIRSFLSKYTDIAQNEIIRTLGERLSIELEPSSHLTMKEIALKLRD